MRRNTKKSPGLALSLLMTTQYLRGIVSELARLFVLPTIIESNSPSLNHLRLCQPVIYSWFKIAQFFRPSSVNMLQIFTSRWLDLISESLQLYHFFLSSQWPRLGRKGVPHLFIDRLFYQKMTSRTSLSFSFSLYMYWMFAWYLRLYRHLLYDSFKCEATLAMKDIYIFLIALTNIEPTV